MDAISPQYPPDFSATPEERLFAHPYSAAFIAIADRLNLSPDALRIIAEAAERRSTKEELTRIDQKIAELRRCSLRSRIVSETNGINPQ